MRGVSSGFVEREALTKTLMEKGDVRRKVGGGRGFLAKKGSEHSWLWAGWGDQGGAPSEQCFREGCHVIFSRRGERRETVEVGKGRRKRFNYPDDKAHGHGNRKG